MSAIVFVLCILTSLACAVLLFRQFFRTQMRLLFWSALCFSALAINNLFVLLDIVLLPDVYLLGWRQFFSLTAVCILLYGFIWETE
jgi:hypothetical protein